MPSGDCTFVRFLMLVARPVSAGCFFRGRWVRWTGLDLTERCAKVTSGADKSNKFTLIVLEFSQALTLLSFLPNKCQIPTSQDSMVLKVKFCCAYKSLVSKSNLFETIKIPTKETRGEILSGASSNHSRPYQVSSIWASPT